MRGYVPPDPETKVSQLNYAVVYIPKKSRNRFAANCVEIVDSETSAQQLADPMNKRYAAKVLGPSKSSEGQLIYYLVEWLS